MINRDQLLDLIKNKQAITSEDGVFTQITSLCGYPHERNARIEQTLDKMVKFNLEYIKTTDIKTIKNSITSFTLDGFREKISQQNNTTPASRMTT